MSAVPPNGCARGLLFALPIGLLMWAWIIWAAVTIF